MEMDEHGETWIPQTLFNKKNTAKTATFLPRIRLDWGQMETDCWGETWIPERWASRCTRCTKPGTRFIQLPGHP